MLDELRYEELVRGATLDARWGITSTQFWLTVVLECLRRVPRDQAAPIFAKDTLSSKNRVSLGTLSEFEKMERLFVSFQLCLISSISG